jgi:hypothetical protein
MSSTHRSTRTHRAARALAGLLLLGTAACEALYGEFSIDNPDNCVRNATLCQAPDQACNPLTTLCEPAVLLSGVDPPGGANLGGQTLTISGDRFVPGMSVTIDGVPATQVSVNGPQELTAVTPPRPGRQGLVTVELIHPQGQRVQSGSLFRYYALVSFQQTCIQGPPGPRLIRTGDLDRDGKTDMIVSGFTTSRVYLSSGDGMNFHSPPDLNVGGAPTALSLADVTGN